MFHSVPPTLVELFEGCEYPWEILPKIEATILSVVQKDCGEYSLLKEGVWVGENVKISPLSTIEAPCVIGANTEIRPGAYIRGKVFIGKNCVVGNSTELKNCILLDGVQVPHYNYVGDSVLGCYSHLGAGSICSNLKSDKTQVVIHGEEDYPTHLKKVGAFLGDRADVGCGCVLNPGTIIGRETSVYPLNALRGVFPPSSIVKKQETVVKRRVER